MSFDSEAIQRELIAAAISPELAELGRTMNAQKLPVASGLEVLRLLRAVTCGSIHNPYGLGIAMGMSRDEARKNAPTAMMLGLVDYLGADTPGYDTFIT
jgi:hypothetical protein